MPRKPGVDYGKFGVEKIEGAFPLFDADSYLAEPHCASRLPEMLKQRIRAHGVRNSHLLSIAPTGTISLAFADNAANGIEPAYAWTYQRKKREADGSHKTYDVEDHAWRLYRHLGGDMKSLPLQFVTALEISALDHMRMVAAVAPFVDSAISKTVNVPADYAFEAFKDLYLEAWRAGLKGITTYRPNDVLGSVLSVSADEQQPIRIAVSASMRHRSRHFRVCAGQDARHWQPEIPHGHICSRRHSVNLRFLSGMSKTITCTRSKCGSMAMNSRVELGQWPRPCPWTCERGTVCGYV